MNRTSELICEFITEAYPILQDLSVQFKDAFHNKKAGTLELNCFDKIKACVVMLQIPVISLKYWDGSCVSTVERLITDALQSAVEPFCNEWEVTPFNAYEYMNILPQDTLWFATHTESHYPEFERLVCADQVLMLDSEPQVCGDNEWEDYWF